MLRNDYSEIAAPDVLRTLSDHITEQNTGYGLDGYCASAEKKILARFGLGADACVHFLEGGTQTNMTVISFLLRPFEAVIACPTGHINVHETGAVEASGHKVLLAPAKDGKLLPEGIDEVVAKHTDEHMVKPRLVYISDSTETGTVYTKSELLAIRAACDRNDLLLFIDGARLGVALTSEDSDLAPEEFAAIPDVFYVGGTKNGALFGEAVVFRDGTLAKDFRYHIKNRGAMMAKGFLLGLQFDALFTDDLYFRLARHSNRMAHAIREGLTTLGIPMVGSAKSNQIFLRLPRHSAKTLIDAFGLELWEDLGDELIVRAVTSFATDPSEVDAFLSFFGN